jgi:carboxymethylenebutenolidase
MTRTFIKAQTREGQSRLFSFVAAVFLLPALLRAEPVKAKLLCMKIQLSRALGLSALLSLPLALSPVTAHAQDWAKTRLEASPRHREYVTLKHDARSLQALVVYPEVKNKATVVILIHEIFGLSDWAKEMADELAAEGFIVIAPDLLSGHGPNGGGSDAIPSQDDRVKAVSALDPAEVMADLDSAADYGKKLPASNGMIAVAGFCWGGGKSFAFAAHRKDLSAAFVFYGTGPADVSTITAPVYGFYAGEDARVGATVPATKDAMKAASKFYDPVTYDGAGHGFMRAGEDPGNKNPANTTARDQAFARLVKQLKDLKSAHAANPASSRGVQSRESGTRQPDCHDRLQNPA